MGPAARIEPGPKSFWGLNWLQNQDFGQSITKARCLNFYGWSGISFNAPRINEINLESNPVLSCPLILRVIRNQFSHFKSLRLVRRHLARVPNKVIQAKCALVPRLAFPIFLPAVRWLFNGGLSFGNI
jgi:hypothetical protein